jgi:hypothetical protein
MAALRTVPHLIAFACMALLLFRGFAARRPLVLGSTLAGFALGTGGALVLMNYFPGEFSFGLLRNLVCGGFIGLWGVCFGALYRSTGRELPHSWDQRLAGTAPFAAACSLVVAALAGAICATRLPGGNPALWGGALLLAAVALALAAAVVERRLPASWSMSFAGLSAGVVALLLYSSSSVTRLDLFAPLTMKVMKFTHDFVHQFFESMLIPDHLFIHRYLWGYIGLLFGKEVGFWGGLVIWFTPVVLVALAVSLERLPSVAHIRQGAQRRRELAAALRLRRIRLVLPVLAVFVLAFAVYRSLYPSVEYWDPKPVLVSANAAGEIVIPKKGDLDLEDGKLHKFLYRRGDREARFFVLLTPAGKLTVDLDACAICKPDGYGQAEGTVICYYCKTLIPLETVGMPGGCNPVPVGFIDKPDGVHLDGLSLINTWGSTVQSTTRVKEGGK